MRPIVIGVGYTWSDDNTRKDTRWKALSTFATKAAEHGRKLAISSLSKDVSTDDCKYIKNSELIKNSLIPRINVTRLRASAGRFIWEHISQRIREADVLIFDVTPIKKNQKGAKETSGNVWIEIGYALSFTEKQIFIVHSEKIGFRSMPNDLRGLLIGQIPNDARAVDKSLRSGVVGAIRRIILEQIRK